MFYKRKNICTTETLHFTACGRLESELGYFREHLLALGCMVAWAVQSAHVIARNHSFGNIVRMMQPEQLLPETCASRHTLILN